MTPTALAYLILGLVTLFWPMVTVLTRRRILGAQWLLIAAAVMLGIAFILYGCLFNTFLRGEYLLLVLYMAFALFTPPVAVLATVVLTRPDGATRLSRAAVIPPLVTAVLLIASILIGGADMYRLWINRGSYGEADYFFAHSWRYNLLVSIHYYLFSAVFSLEVLFVALYTIVHLRRYRRILNEYFPQELHRVARHRSLYMLILLISLTLIVASVRYPLNMPRPVPFTVVSSVVLGLATLILGFAIYRLNYSAETLKEELSSSLLRTRRDLSQLGREISAYVERSAYIDPDLSVFQLSNHFHVSQDQVVDAIHRLHGTSFGDYLDNLRIDHAATLLSNVSHPDDPDTLSRIAHQCGYLTPDALKQAFEKVMHTPIGRSGLL